MWEGAGLSRQWGATARGRGLEATQRGGRGSVGRRRRRWRMWATHGLAVAVALSVLPGSRSLRPGDCEGAVGPGSARCGWRGGGAEPNQARSGREAGAGAGGGGGCPPRGPSDEGQRPGPEDVSWA